MRQYWCEPHVPAIPTVVHTVHQLVYRPQVTFDPWEDIDTLWESNNVWISVKELTLVVGSCQIESSPPPNILMQIIPTYTTWYMYMACLEIILFFEDTVQREVNFLPHLIVDLKPIKSNIVGVSPWAQQLQLVHNWQFRLRKTPNSIQYW